MIQNFANKGTEDIFQGEDTKNARRVLPFELQNRAQRQLLFLDAVRVIEELKSPPSRRLESLKGDRKGCWSIRINDQFRIVFRFENSNAKDVEICDYH